MKAAIILQESNGVWAGAVGSWQWADILALPTALIQSWKNPSPTAPGWPSLPTAIAHYRDQGCQVAYVWRDGWELFHLA